MCMEVRREMKQPMHARRLFHRRIVTIASSIKRTLLRNVWKPMRGPSSARAAVVHRHPFLRVILCGLRGLGDGFHMAVAEQYVGCVQVIGRNCVVVGSAHPVEVDVIAMRW